MPASRAAAAISCQARIESALERHMPHGIRHGGGCDLQHAGGRPFEIDSERHSQFLAQGFLCRGAIQTHLAAEKTFR